MTIPPYLILRRKMPTRNYVCIARIRYNVKARECEVLSIIAGCRMWAAFDEAFEHYIGAGKYMPTKWTPEHAKTRRWRHVERAESLYTLFLLYRDVQKVERLVQEGKSPRPRKR